jgi:glycosyltransferase involved in cell wall biosynthesis
MKVLLCIAGLSSGGGERQLLLLADGIVQLGHKVVLNVFGVKETNHYNLSNTSGMKVVYTEVAKNDNRFIAVIKILLTIRRLNKSERPDILLGTLFIAGCAVRICKFAGIINCPVISTIRTDFKFIYSNWRKYVETFLWRYQDALITNHLPTAIYLENDKKIKAVYIPNGLVGLGGCKKKTHDGAVTIFAVVGQFRFEWKRQNRIIDALKKIKNTEKSCNFKCNFYGQGKDGDALFKMIVESGMENYCSIHRPVEDIGVVFENSDALIHASTLEGCPNVVIEAMSCDVPVILSRYSASLVVDDHDDLTIISKTDDAVSLAECIKIFVEMSPAERYLLGKRGGKFVREKYAVERMVKDHVDLFEKLLVKGSTINP